jgi:tetratricopeptide (TPR) repeat protein
MPIAVALAGCVDSAQPPEAAPRALPPGAEAISLLGTPLLVAPLRDDQRATLEDELTAARTALEDAPMDREALIWVGRRTAYLGRYRDAIAVFTDGITRFPGDARFYRHRGHRYITVREFDRAIADLERAATLTAGTPDEVEPDGRPNARNIPTTTLQSNIRYHLALARYLQGDFVRAADAWRAAREAVNNPDNLVSASHWLYLTLRRLGRDDEAARVLEPVSADLDVIENGSYLSLLLLYRGERSAAEVVRAAGEGPSGAAVSYGVSIWHLVNGRRDEAEQTWRALATEANWASFGVIAAEAELARMK